MFLDLPEKDRIALLEAELIKARKEMKNLNKVSSHIFHNLLSSAFYGKRLIKKYLKSEISFIKYIFIDYIAETGQI